MDGIEVKIINSFSVYVYMCFCIQQISDQPVKAFKEGRVASIPLIMVG